MRQKENASGGRAEGIFAAVSAHRPGVAALTRPALACALEGVFQLKEEEEEKKTTVFGLGTGKQLAEKQSRVVLHTSLHLTFTAGTWSDSIPLLTDEEGKSYFL